MTTARVLLIGYGNPLRGDDALGPMVVEELRPRLSGSELSGVECVSCHQLAPELAENLSRCELAIFVDADASGEAGTVRVQRLQPEADGAASLTHHAQPTALLALAAELYGRAPQAFLVTGAGATFEGRDLLSEQGKSALIEICHIVPRLIQEFFNSG